MKHKYYQILSFDISNDENSKLLSKQFSIVKKLITDTKCLSETQEKYCNMLDNLEKQCAETIEHNREEEQRLRREKVKNMYI
jgi:hypothetical protein